MPAHTHNFSAGINIKNNFFTQCFIAAYPLECSAFHMAQHGHVFIWVDRWKIEHGQFAIPRCDQ